MKALLSVFDKVGIQEFAAGLHGLGWELLSSGGTASITVNQFTFDKNIDDTKYLFGISVNGIPSGDEVITVTPKNEKLVDVVNNFSTTSQNSNTVNLNNTIPSITNTEINSDNTQIAITFSEQVYKTNSGAGVS